MYPQSLQLIPDSIELNEIVLENKGLLFFEGSGIGFGLSNFFLAASRSNLIHLVILALSDDHFKDNAFT